MSDKSTEWTGSGLTIKSGEAVQRAWRGEILWFGQCPASGFE